MSEFGVCFLTGVPCTTEGGLKVRIEFSSVYNYIHVR